MPIEVILNEASAATLRATGFQATKGGNGVGLPLDLRVRATGTPSSSVQVIRGPSGSASLASRAGSEAGQSYITVSSETELVPVPPTDSSGGKTRYIIQHVDRANNPGAHHVCVDSLAPYALIPHVVLAEIVQPASRADIQPDMIFDMREVANPREKTERMTRPSAGTDTGMVLNANGADGEWFPNSGGDQDIPIPEWATYAQITATWAGIKYQSGTNPFGQHWVEFGPYLRPSTREKSTDRFDFDAPGGSNSRDNWIMGDTVYIPKLTAGGSPFRGSVQKFVMKARYWTTNSGAFMDQHSGIILDVRFVETADQVD